MGLIPGSGRSPGGGHGNPLQYSCLENPMDRGAWQATVHRVTQSQTQLKQISTAWHNGSVSISLNLLLPALYEIFLSSNLEIHLHIYILSYICHNLKLFWGIISYYTKKDNIYPLKPCWNPTPLINLGVVMESYSPRSVGYLCWSRGFQVLKGISPNMPILCIRILILSYQGRDFSIDLLGLWINLP